MSLSKITFKSNSSTQQQNITVEEQLKSEGWELDLFSTFLSRKHAYHKVIGKKHYVKLKKDKIHVDKKLKEDINELRKLLIEEMAKYA